MGVLEFYCAIDQVITWLRDLYVILRVEVVVRVSREKLSDGVPRKIATAAKPVAYHRVTAAAPA